MKESMRFLFFSITHGRAHSIGNLKKFLEFNPLLKRTCREKIYRNWSSKTSIFSLPSKEGPRGRRDQQREQRTGEGSDQGQGPNKRR
jgi:hypothetical protein